MQYVFLIRSRAGGKKYIKNTYCMGQRPFLFLLLIYLRFLTVFYSKFYQYFTQKHGTLFIADVVRT